MSDEFYSVDDLKKKLKNRQHSGGHLRFSFSFNNLEISSSFLKFLSSDVKESEEFEWDDDLKINNIAATTEDHEEYFKGR